MKSKEKSFDLFYENKMKAKSLNEDYDKVFLDIVNYVSRHQKDITKANILLSYVVDQMLEHQMNIGDVNKLIDKGMKEHIQKVDKSIAYKEEIPKMKKFDFEKYTISGLWLTMCGYLVLLFVKEFLTDRYLIGFSIDLIVAAVAMVVTFIGLKNHWNLIARYQLTRKPFIMEIAGIIVGLFITIMTLKSPFDVSFLILVIAHLFSKKIFKSEIMK